MIVLILVLALAAAITYLIYRSPRAGAAAALLWVAGLVVGWLIARFVSF